jgi:hypothetical protein
MPERGVHWKVSRVDLRNYETVCCTPELLVQIARTPIDFINQAPSTHQAAAEPKAEEPMRRSTADTHNELEEFLL